MFFCLFGFTWERVSSRPVLEAFLSVSQPSSINENADGCTQINKTTSQINEHADGDMEIYDFSFHKSTTVASKMNENTDGCMQTNDLTSKSMKMLTVT